ncbi:hypothetical protein NIES2100_64800 [Calothrix sp. NIES-2100]|nr:hypothetical protein NIES2100_64800 [Calothrix sp. NIES-2100]
MPPGPENRWNFRCFEAPVLRSGSDQLESWLINCCHEDKACATVFTYLDYKIVVYKFYYILRKKYDTHLFLRLSRPVGVFMPAFGVASRCHRQSIIPYLEDLGRFLAVPMKKYFVAIYQNREGGQGGQGGQESSRRNNQCPMTAVATTGETPRQFAQVGKPAHATGFATHCLPNAQCRKTTDN